MQTLIVNFKIINKTKFYFCFKDVDYSFILQKCAAKIKSNQSKVKLRKSIVDSNSNFSDRTRDIRNRRDFSRPQLTCVLTFPLKV